MGYLDSYDKTEQAYYQGNDFGNYQFCSLEDIINQFMVVYVGDQKIINKTSRVDVAFHAQRALSELSFDTFKSVKAQEIVVPNTLQMILPHDYVNYTKLSWSDSSGIKHPLYPTKHTSNPFSIKQDDDGIYEFPGNAELLTNPDFEDPLVDPWFSSTIAANTVSGSDDEIAILGVAHGFESGTLVFTQYVYDKYGNSMSRAYAVWQVLNVTGISKLEISGKGWSAVASGDALAATLRFGISSTPGSNDTIAQPESAATSPNVDVPDLGYVEWSAGEQGTTKELTDSNGDAIDVSNYDNVYVLITCFVDHTGGGNTTASISYIDDLSVKDVSASYPLTQKNNTGHSETWKSYKSTTPSENNNDDYEDDTYWPAEGSRFGLDPSHAQANGSFFIDQRLGKIHFSSNISGKTVILDYISDSLGTDAEMKVHKLAEEAMYRYILHAVAAGRIQTQQIVPRLKKEKFAAMRQAKLRLSNIKLEELTQILRGKSKQIKH